MCGMCISASRCCAPSCYFKCGVCVICSLLMFVSDATGDHMTTHTINEPPTHHHNQQHDYKTATKSTNIYKLQESRQFTKDTESAFAHCQYNFHKHHSDGKQTQ